MQKARYSVQNTERVKLALNNFLVIHPLSDFRPITALNKISPERAMSLMHPLAPVDLPGIDKIGKFELLEATLFVAYTKLANTIRDAGGAERFQTEFSLPGNPRLPIKFKRDPAKVTITDLKINPDKELVRLDYPAYKLMLPAKEKYIGKSENEVSSLFVSARPLVSNSHCSVLELNRLLRNLFASELFLEAARYAEEAIEREPAANPAGNGKKFHLDAAKSYIIRLDGTSSKFPSAFVLKRMVFPLNRLVACFEDLVLAVHKMVAFSGHDNL